MGFELVYNDDARKALVQFSDGKRVLLTTRIMFYPELASRNGRK